MARSHKENQRFTFVEPCLNSSISTSFFIFQGTKMAIKRAPSGIRILLTRKSKASKMLFPKIDTSLNKPYDSAEGIPTTKISKPEIQDSFIRLCCSPLAKEATIISNIENADVKVANKNSAKKKV